MPPKRKAERSAKGKSKAPVYKKCPPLPDGTVITDFVKQSWSLGKNFASGGFGLIYFAKKIDAAKPRSSKNAVSSKANDYVIKMELHDNGPLYTETHVYQGMARPAHIAEFKRSRGLKFLGIPPYIAAGRHQASNTEFRFLVMPRYGMDVERVRTEVCGGQLPAGAVFQLAMTSLDALEYMHHHLYVHSDLKAENILLESAGVPANPLDLTRCYLVDFGLCRRSMPPYEYRECPKKGHDGTLIFTSIDAHRGVKTTFRTDIEILGYNLLIWLSGALPWQLLDQDPAAVQKAKEGFRKDPAKGTKKAFHDSPNARFCDLMAAFMEAAYGIEYGAAPDYEYFRDLMTEGAQIAKKMKATPRSTRKQQSSSSDRSTTGGRRQPSTSEDAPARKSRKSPVTKTTTGASSNRAAAGASSSTKTGFATPASRTRREPKTSMKIAAANEDAILVVDSDDNTSGSSSVATKSSVSDRGNSIIPGLRKTAGTKEAGKKRHRSPSQTSKHVETAGRSHVYDVDQDSATSSISKRGKRNISPQKRGKSKIEIKPNVVCDISSSAASPPLFDDDDEDDCRDKNTMSGFSDALKSRYVPSGLERAHGGVVDAAVAGIRSAQMGLRLAKEFQTKTSISSSKTTSLARDTFQTNGVPGYSTRLKIDDGVGKNCLNHAMSSPDDVISPSMTGRRRNIVRDDSTSSDDQLYGEEIATKRGVENSTNGKLSKSHVAGVNDPRSTGFVSGTGSTKISSRVYDADNDDCGDGLSMISSGSFLPGAINLSRRPIRDSASSASSLASSRISVESYTCRDDVGSYGGKSVARGIVGEVRSGFNPCSATRFPCGGTTKANAAASNQLGANTKRDSGNLNITNPKSRFGIEANSFAEDGDDSADDVVNNCNGNDSSEDDSFDEDDEDNISPASKFKPSGFVTRRPAPIKKRVSTIRTHPPTSASTTAVYGSGATIGCGSRFNRRNSIIPGLAAGAWNRTRKRSVAEPKSNSGKSRFCNGSEQLTTNSAAAADRRNAARKSIVGAQMVMKKYTRNGRKSGLMPNNSGFSEAKNASRFDSRNRMGRHTKDAAVNESSSNHSSRIRSAKRTDNFEPNGVEKSSKFGRKFAKDRFNESVHYTATGIQTSPSLLNVL